MAKLIVNMLKINRGGNKFLTRPAQFAVVKKASWMSLDTGENSLDIEQVLYPTLSLITYSIVGSIATNALANSDDDGDEDDQQQDSE